MMRVIAIKRTYCIHVCDTYYSYFFTATVIIILLLQQTDGMCEYELQSSLVLWIMETTTPHNERKATNHLNKFTGLAFFANITYGDGFGAVCAKESLKVPDLANMFWIVAVYCCIMCFHRRKILMKIICQMKRINIWVTLQSH